MDGVDAFTRLVLNGQLLTLDFVSSLGIMGGMLDF